MSSSKHSGHCNGSLKPVANDLCRVPNGASLHSIAATDAIDQSHATADQARLPQRSPKQENFEEVPYHIVLLCYLSYAVLILFGYLRDFMRKTGLEKNMAAVESNREVCHRFGSGSSPTNSFFLRATRACIRTLKVSTRETSTGGSEMRGIDRLPVCPVPTST